MSSIRTALFGLIAILFMPYSLFSAEGTIGDKYDELSVRGKIYHKVKVHKITPQGLTIFHSKGIAQVPFSQLSPELQGFYGYDKQAEASYLEKRGKREAEALAKESVSRSRLTSGKVVSENFVLELFGSPPNLKSAVDMRADFNALDLHVKDQGRRPSCAIFAVVSALEFQNAKAAGKPEKLSEEYLIWATRKSLGIAQENNSQYEVAQDGDLGFTLLEVIQALRSYGIPDSELMPNTFGTSMASIEEPDDGIIKEARERRKVTATYITGRTNEAKIANIIHALNADIPVVVGVDWPNNATLQSAPLLSKQKPFYGHAVTLVGYKCDSGNLEAARFLFKNSWGRRWGINGHGWITYEYLRNNLSSAAIVDVQ